MKPEVRRAIARRLEERSSTYAAEAAEHRRLAARCEAEGEWLRLRHHERSTLRMAEHCRIVAAKLEEAAHQLAGLAADHEAVARELEGRAAP